MIEADPRQRGWLVQILRAADDDAQSLASKESTLKRLGYHPMCVGTRAEALAAVKQTPPAAIIVDLLMPAMKGFELLDQSRRMPAGRSVPTIAWSSRELPENERQQLRTSAQKMALRNQGDTEAMLEELRPYIARSERSRKTRSRAA